MSTTQQVKTASSEAKKATGVPEKQTVAQTAAATTTTDKPLPETPSTSHANQKLVKKTKKKGAAAMKTAWIAAHATTLATGAIYAGYYALYISHISWTSFLAYRFCLLGSFVAYSITILSQFSRKSLPNSIALLSTTNYQYLLLTWIWFFNRSSLFKIIPYLITSLLQLAQQFNVQPILKLSPQLKLVAAYDELVLFVVLFVDTLLMRGTSGFALVIYAGFYWLRIVENEDTRYLLYSIASKLDSTMSKQKNPKVVESWKDIKRFLTSRNGDIAREFLQ